MQRRKIIVDMPLVRPFLSDPGSERPDSCMRECRAAASPAPALGTAWPPSDVDLEAWLCADSPSSVLPQRMSGGVQHRETQRYEKRRQDVA